MTRQDSPRTATLAELCHEAVQRYGDDWGQIQAYVAKRIAAMPREDRERLTADVGRLLSFCAPIRSSVLH
ncbi:hypothetical protein HPT29_006055 [Microvirga terrae]|uniref:Uncharacterized protein n=1 Tax=Microvirga terrae TaxID=2740529 RepID=A0ABY5RTV5_9HYPH|nr:MULTISPECIES: hypothetical protein [Microvirga]MBQ0822464.1 hypothetical protein [Microvirga sp. HBU67558]UVF20688.1 hypothetical protein HPT29_006055 [Microvirga terrae]